MLSPELSPIHRIVSEWFHSERMPTPFQVTSLLESLLAAALAEIQISRQHAINFDPFSDFRFKWAQQYLAVAANDRKEIDSDVTNLVSMFFFPPTPITHKHRAANDLS